MFDAIVIDDRGLVIGDEVLCSREELVQYAADWSIWPCGPTVRVAVLDTVPEEKFRRIGELLAQCWPGANIIVERFFFTPQRPAHWR